jgi:D-arabinose 1-dehydrogenase-like Zn-dependent alcohol dehydrogenase
MRALQLTGFGAPDVLTMTRVRTPTAGPRDVIVRVAYCGICRHDILSRQGAFPNVHPPVIPGHQISGHVAAVGSHVVDIPIGLAVTTMLTVGCGTCKCCAAGDPARCTRSRAEFLGDDRDGGYAEYVRVSSESVIALPLRLDLVDAAIANCTLGTAYHAAVTRGQFTRGETVVITGASGGVGLHAVKLLVHMGVTCIAVTTRQEKAALLASLGAQVVVTPDLDFSKQVRELTEGARADAVLDIVGSRTVNESLRSVRDGGRVVVLGNVDGQSVAIKPAVLILRELSLVGTGSATKDELGAVLEMIAAADVTLEVAAVLPLHEGARAHELVESGALEGRAVLAVGEKAGEWS